MPRVELLNDLNDEQDVAIAWRNLSYLVEAHRWSTYFRGFGGGPKKTILNALNGFIEIGSLVGLLGPSGAGKTTLLNCLAGNSTSGLEDGSEIYLDKERKPTEASFIQQHVQETIIGGLTVGETLAYAYKFKNGNIFENNEMKQHIDQVLKQLSLDDQILQRRFEQCSGGEQKRIAIAQELMSRRRPPQFLFIDEPTTGLDSNAALLVMQCLRRLTEKPEPLTVVTSIHAPSNEILNLFHRLYILAKGGIAIFAGPPQELQSSLVDKVHLTILPQEPPIETLLRLACNGTDNETVVNLARETQFSQYETISTNLAQLQLYPNGFPTKPKTFAPVDLVTMGRRYCRITFRVGWPALAFQLGIMLFYMILMRLLFQSNMSHTDACFSLADAGVDGNSTCSIDIKRMSLLKQNIHFHGILLMFFGFNVACISALVFAPLALVFANEHRNGWYSLGVFYSTACAYSFASGTLLASLTIPIGYFLTEQHVADSYEFNLVRLGYYFYFIWLAIIYAQGIGQLCGVAVRGNAEIATVGTLVVTALLIMLNGYTVDSYYTQNPMLIAAETLAQQKPIFHGLMWTIYGYDRCRGEAQYSEVMRHYNVDVEKVLVNSRGVVINIVIIRLLTLIVFYFNFNSWKRHKCPEKTDVNEMKQMELGEETTKNVKIEMEKNGSRLRALAARARTVEDEEFRKFARKKVCIAWRSLSLFADKTFSERAQKIEDPKAPSLLLKQLNGYCRFGTLTALMGTSGAGKTTLLKVLNGRDASRLCDDTQIHLNRHTKISTCFLTQDVSGHLLPGLTAGQTLIYASRLKNANVDESVDHSRIARDLLFELAILDTLDTPVERCSGGERKRLALAAELTCLHMPNLVCIDEPTSGLDSNSAEVVVACLRSVAQAHNISIVASVHQPTSELLRMFHSIYVLARGGVCIYSGPPEAIQSHLDKVPSLWSKKSPFPIETLIKQSCCAYPDPTVLELVNLTNQTLKAELEDSGLLTTETRLATDGITHNRRRFSLHDVRILCSRYSSFILGNHWIILLTFTILDFIYGFTLTTFFPAAIANPSGCLDLEEDFNNTCAKTPARLLEEDFLMFNFQYFYYVFLYFTFIIMIQGALEFSHDLIYFLNEHRNGWYSTGSFFVVKNLFDFVPLVLVVPIYAYITDIYEGVLPGVYWRLLFILWMTAFSYQSFAHLIAVVSHGHLASIVINSVCALLVTGVLTDYWVPVKDMHYGFQLIANWLNPGRYLVQLITLTIYGRGRCKEREVQVLMYKFSLRDEDHNTAVITMLVLGVLYRLLTLSLLLKRAKRTGVRRERIERIEYSIAHLQPSKLNHLVGMSNELEGLRIKVRQF